MDLRSPEFWTAVVTAVGALVATFGAITAFSATSRLRASIERDQKIAVAAAADVSRTALELSLRQRLYRLVARIEHPVFRTPVYLYALLNVGLFALTRSSDSDLGAPLFLVAGTVICASIFFIVVQEARGVIGRMRYLVVYRDRASRLAMRDLGEDARSWNTAAHWLGVALLLLITLLLVTTTVHFDSHDERRLWPYMAVISLALILPVAALLLRQLSRLRTRLKTVTDRERSLADIGEKLRAMSVDVRELKAAELAAPRHSTERTTAHVKWLQADRRLEALKDEFTEQWMKSGEGRLTGIAEVDDETQRRFRVFTYRRHAQQVDEVLGAS